jgi:hypothetical protein
MSNVDTSRLQVWESASEAKRRERAYPDVTITFTPPGLREIDAMPCQERVLEGIKQTLYQELQTFLLSPHKVSYTDKSFFSQPYLDKPFKQD